MTHPERMSAEAQGAELRPTLYPVEGCGECAELLAAHLLGAPVYGVMERHLDGHVSRPGRLWGTTASALTTQEAEDA